LTDTHATLFKGMWDPYHVNSIELGSHGDILISARNTWTIYDVNLRSGAIVWQLGGKQTSFRLSAGVRFAFQHDAQFEGPNLISVFDNEAGPNVGPQSRALLLRLSMTTMTATVVDQYTHVGVLANSQGSVQLLANGDVFVGWGAQPVYSEFTRNGRLLYDARFPGVDQSYRAFRSRWVGHPAGRPAVALRASAGAAGHMTVYASWNGATQIARWQVLAGASANQLSPVTSQARTGFETALMTTASGPFFAVRALNAAGQVLGTSRTVRE
jgi:hypothetical protein